jgi:transcriptional regulator NrdR family protein
MQVPIGDSSVTNSRFFPGQNIIWRRRSTSGGLLFSTREKIDLTNTRVIKRHSRPSEMYQPAKLLLSLYKCLSHRLDAARSSWELMQTVENNLIIYAQKGLLSSDDIAREALATLKAFDSNAYIAYGRYQTNLLSGDKIDRLI